MTLNQILKTMSVQKTNKKRGMIMDRYIIGESSCGKTKKLLEVAKETNAVVVCWNPDAMRVKAQNYGFYGLEFYGYDEIRDLREGRNIVVDELKDFFKYALNFKLEGFNLTID